MHLLCVLIGMVALVDSAVHAQPEDDAPVEETVALEAEAPVVYAPVHAPLSYDPYYVLPGGPGYTSVDIGVRSFCLYVQRPQGRERYRGHGQIQSPRSP